MIWHQHISQTSKCKFAAIALEDFQDFCTDSIFDEPIATECGDRRYEMSAAFEIENLMTTEHMYVVLRPGMRDACRGV